MKKGKKIAICIVVVLLGLCAWLMLTPNVLMCRFVLAVCRDDFDRCALYCIDNDLNVRSSLEGRWYFYDNEFNEYHTTGDAAIDASISKIMTIYLFGSIDNFDGRAVFMLNRIPYSRKTGYALQYAPNNDPLGYYGYDVINQPLGNGWYYSYFSDVSSG